MRKQFTHGPWCPFYEGPMPFSWWVTFFCLRGNSKYQPGEQLRLIA